MNLQLFFLAAVIISAPFVWLLPREWQGRVMILTTLAVLLYLAPVSIALLVTTAVLQWILWYFSSGKYNKIAIIVSIFLPVIPLLLFKIGSKTDSWIIPLGLSYFAFRQIHVAFEFYKKQIQIPTVSQYFQYLLFLPVFLVGPIHRMPEFERSLRRKKWQPDMISEGFERILYGMVKVFFLGNYFFTGQFDKLVAQIDGPLLRIYVKMVGFTWNAYLQFAGFSDLAIGMALLWGIRVMENFNRPFMATNMQEFWQRWHISLSAWCRDYVFHPVNALSRNRWLALTISMIVLAAWHELSIRYILWGLFHIILILLTAKLKTTMPVLSRFLNEDKSGRWIARLWVFHLFAFSCLFIGAINANDIPPQLYKFFN